MTTITDLVSKRLNEGKTVAELATQLGMTDEALRRIEGGRTINPRPRNKKAVADYLGCQVTDLWPVESRPQEALVS